MISDPHAPLNDPAYQPHHPPTRDGRIPEVVQRWAARSQIRWFQRFQNQLDRTKTSDLSGYYTESLAHPDDCCVQCDQEYLYGCDDDPCCCRATAPGLIAAYLEEKKAVKELTAIQTARREESEAVGSDQTYDGIRDYAIDQCIQTGRPPLEDWKACIRDAIMELDRIIYHPGMHPDGVMRARFAMGALAGIWLTPDELDKRYGETPGE